MAGFVATALGLIFFAAAGFTDAGATTAAAGAAAPHPATVEDPAQPWSPLAQRLTSADMAAAFEFRHFQVFGFQRRRLAVRINIDAIGLSSTRVGLGWIAFVNDDFGLTAARGGIGFGVIDVVFFQGSTLQGAGADEPTGIRTARNPGIDFRCRPNRLVGRTNTNGCNRTDIRHFRKGEIGKGERWAIRARTGAPGHNERCSHNKHLMIWQPPSHASPCSYMCGAGALQLAQMSAGLPRRRSCHKGVIPASFGLIGHTKKAAPGWHRLLNCRFGRMIALAQSD